MKPTITIRHQARDYYRRPTQGGGRDAYDYGRTVLDTDGGESWASAIAVCLVAALIVVALYVITP